MLNDMQGMKKLDLWDLLISIHFSKYSLFTRSRATIDED